jgi:hypothetical protein
MILRGTDAEDPMTRFVYSLKSNRIELDWKMIRCGVPSGNKAANDRAPTSHEVRRLVEYDDPRIKSIIHPS